MISWMLTDPGLLTLTWVIPILTVLALLPVRGDNLKAIRGISLASAGLNLALMIHLLVKFVALDAAPALGEKITQLKFSAKIPWFEMLNINYFIGVDGISMLMMVLAGTILFCGVLISWRMEERIKEFFIYTNVLASGVFGCFISFDLFTFFLFNEVTLIPTYLLIGVFGSGRKEYAAMKLNLMLIAGSALILTGVLGLYFESGIRSFDMLELSQVHFSSGFQLWAFPLLFTGFGVLGAMFPFHTWSPDGHSSAPTAISMFLAGVHMKLGGYGCLRVAMYLLPEGAHQWMDLFLVLATIGVVYGAFVAVKQTDLKYINAYSSVSHCGLVLFGYAALNFIGIKGAVLQMVSHGFLTALFFCLIGMVYYRTHTRIVADMGGLMKVMPFIGVSFAIVGFAGLGLPGLSGFVAELTIFIGAFMETSALNRVCTILCVLSIIITAVYILRAVNAVMHGPERPEFKGLGDATFMEKAAALPLLTGIIGMGLYPWWIIRVVDNAVLPIINNLARVLP